MNQVSTVGLDLAKYIFQLHGADSAGAVVFRKKLRRGQLLAFLATLPPCTVAMEACGSAHLGRMLARKPPMLVRVALANKMARIVWALLAKGGVYRAPVTAV